MTLYEKRGRRYVPARDTMAYDGLPDGDWLIAVRKGRTTCRRVVEPDLAGFLAAAQVAEDAMLGAVAEASRRRPRERELSGRERKAFEAYAAIMGDRMMWLESSSCQEIVDAGIAAVRSAYRGNGTGRSS